MLASREEKEWKKKLKKLEAKFNWNDAIKRIN